MKKFIAIITVLALLIGIFQVPTGIYAEEKPQVALKQAIEIAKSTLSLNTEGFEFTSSYIENQNGYNIWSLSWNRIKDGQENISVSVDSTNGEIVSVGWYRPYEQPKSRIPKYTKAEALKAAEAWAKKLQGEKFKLTKLREAQGQDYYSKYSDVIVFDFVRVQDGIEATPNIITVQLDKNTLNLRHFNIMWDKGSLPSKANAISLDKAKEIFKNKLGLELTYNFIYDNPSNEPKAVLVYSLKNGNDPIDAISGDLLKNMYRVYYAMNKAATAEVAQAVPITPQEQNVIDDQSKYITKEEAEKVVKQYIKLDETTKLDSANLYPGYHKINATWNLQWKSVSTDGKTIKYVNATVDAVTKEFRSLYTYYNNENNNTGTTKLTIEQARKIADEFLAKVQPDKFKKVQYTETRDAYGIMPAYQNGYSFNYIRVENGIPCPANTLFMTVDEYTGDVKSYNSNWNDVNFPAADKAITLDKAYELLFSNVKFNMEYIHHYPNINDYTNREIKLAYMLENIPVLMDASTGKMLNYDGTPIKKDEKLVYTDIKGNKAEEEINILIEMGILVPEGATFSPDAPMLQKDFVKLLISSLQEYYPAPVAKTENQYDNYYAEAIRRKLIAQNEKNPDAVMTRLDVAKMILRAMNYGVLAEKGSMFQASFKDAASIPASYKGYTVLAAELGIVPAVQSNFQPTKKITRGDAVEFIVNYLKCETSL